MFLQSLPGLGGLSLGPRLSKSPVGPSLGQKTGSRPEEKEGVFPWRAPPGARAAVGFVCGTAWWQNIEVWVGHGMTGAEVVLVPLDFCI